MEEEVITPNAINTRKYRAYKGEEILKKNFC